MCIHYQSLKVFLKFSLYTSFLIWVSSYDSYCQLPFYKIALLSIVIKTDSHVPSVALDCILSVIFIQLPHASNCFKYYRYVSFNNSYIQNFFGKRAFVLSSTAMKISFINPCFASKYIFHKYLTICCWIITKLML